METKAVFGGSFNPGTLGHEQVLTEVIEQTDISKIILLPSGDRGDKRHGISRDGRKKIIEVFFNTLIKSGINVELDTYFLDAKNGGFTTTAQEEKYFRDKFGESPYFIYGSDIAGDMPSWDGNKDRFIEEKLKKIFITRPGYKFEPEKHNLENFILLDIPYMLDVSSSMAKQMIGNKQDVSDILAPEIIEHIEKNKLYR